MVSICSIILHDAVFVFGQFNDGVRLPSQLTSIFGHLVCKQVIIGFDMDTERKSLSNSTAGP